jgi:Na+-translocating ferredoxin:NAD+ oxidoreductase RnfA subunit
VNWTFINEVLLQVIACSVQLSEIILEVTRPSLLQRVGLHSTFNPRLSDCNTA